MTLGDWLDRIEKLHPIKWDLGLERVSEVAKRLSVVKPAPLIFLVAGTNGKGSVARMIAEGIVDEDACVGLFTSPHLHSFTERFVVDGKPVKVTGKVARIENP